MRSTAASTSGAGLLVSAPGCQATGTYRRTRPPLIAGERGKRPVVDVRVGEGDQPFVAASVVPQQLAEAQHGAERIEDRLESRGARHQRGGCLRVWLVWVVLGAVGDEERGRRELLVVPGDHELPAPQDGGDRVGGGDLGGLVEDDDIEVGQRRQQLADHQRAHRPAGFQCQQHVRSVADEVPDGHVPPLQPGLVLDERGLVLELVACPHGVFGVGAADSR